MSMLKKILATTLLAGTLDISAAFMQAYMAKGILPEIVLQYIASGLLGKDAYTGGISVILLGLAVHYFIAFATTATYFLVYPTTRLLQKSIVLSSTIVALIAWLITTKVIVPLSKIQPAPFDPLKALLLLPFYMFA